MHKRAKHSPPWERAHTANPRFGTRLPIPGVERRDRGHYIESIGTQGTILCHAREIFRAAILGGANAIVLMHNHPSGEPEPSHADISVTRDLIRAGHLLKIELVDHVVVGHNQRCSLRELGHFAHQPPPLDGDFAVEGGIDWLVITF